MKHKDWNQGLVLAAEEHLRPVLDGFVSSETS